MRRGLSYLATGAIALLGAAYVLVFAYAMVARGWTFDAEQVTPLAAAYYEFLFVASESVWIYVAAFCAAALVGAVASWAFPPRRPDSRTTGMPVRAMFWASFVGAALVLAIEGFRLVAVLTQFWDGNLRILAGGLTEVGSAWLFDFALLFACGIVVWTGAAWAFGTERRLDTELATLVVLGVIVVGLKVAILIAIRNLFAGAMLEPNVLALGLVGSIQAVIWVVVMKLKRPSEKHLLEVMA